MLIDFHIHAFSDKIAEKTIQKLAAAADKKSFTDGTVSDTIQKLKNCGVDTGVALNIATKPSQHEVVNNFAAEISSLKDSSLLLYGFGSVFPLPNETNSIENIEKEIKKIKSLGLKGIKIHPDYQGYYFNDSTIYPFYELCADMNILLATHAGVDALCPDDVHCTPSMIREVMENFPKLRLMAAHMGGHLRWDEVYELLAGRDRLYLDTSYIIYSLDKDLAVRIIRRHGADQILFGSDCPWTNPSKTFRYMDSLGLSSAEKDLIFYKNALELLK